MEATSKCSACGTTENVKELTQYGGEELTLCNECLTAKYTGCATCRTFFRDDEEGELVMRDEQAGDVVCIFCRPQKFIDACTNLTGLRDTLNLIADVGADDGNHVDYCNLPTFGGVEPQETKEVFSWDAMRVLVQGSKWMMEDRCDHCGEASFHCKCECQ